MGVQGRIPLPEPPDILDVLSDIFRRILLEKILLKEYKWVEEILTIFAFLTYFYCKPLSEVK